MWAVDGRTKTYHCGRARGDCPTTTVAPYTKGVSDYTTVAVRGRTVRLDTTAAVHGTTARLDAGEEDEEV